MEALIQRDRTVVVYWVREIPFFAPWSLSGGWDRGEIISGSGSRGCPWLQFMRSSLTSLRLTPESRLMFRHGRKFQAMCFYFINSISFRAREKEIWETNGEIERVQIKKIEKKISTSFYKEGLCANCACISNSSYAVCVAFSIGIPHTVHHNRLGLLGDIIFFFLKLVHGAVMVSYSTGRKSKGS